MKRAHYLQHVPFEGLGSIEPWLQQNDYQISCTPLFESAVFPEPEAIDLLIIMGGPMNINDEADYPWLIPEKQFIRTAINAGTPVLGICLGAQLIASVLGAKVYPNRQKEIGWFPIQGIAQSAPSHFALPQDIPAFHWHGETFDLPEGTTWLAQSAACKHQAFQWGNRVVGLQFHLETTPESARALVEHCRDELVADDFVQPEQIILNAPAEYYQATNTLMAHLLHFITA